MTTALELGGILNGGPRMSDRGGGGEGNGEEGGPAVVRLVVAREVGVVGPWWMGWVMMNFVASSWGRDWCRCSGGPGPGLDGERLFRCGVGWKTVEGKTEG